MTARFTRENFEEALVARLQHAIASHRDRHAFCISDTFYTYRQLAEEVGTLRKALHDIEDDNVGLVANDDFYTYAAVLALWMEGKSYVPLHPLQPLKRCEDIIAQVGITSIVDSSGCTRYTHSDVIRPDGLPRCPEAFDAPVATHDGRPAYILFTSGSTGRPKGVPITIDNLSAFVDSLFALGISLTEDDRCLQMFDLTFDMSVGSYVAPLLCGACVYTIRPGSIKWQEVYRLIETYRITEAQLVPSVIHYLRPYFDEISAPDMRYTLFAGEALPADDTAAWQKCVPNAEVWNVYGPTENTVYSTGYLVPRSDMAACNGIVGIGKAMKHVETIIVDEQGRRVKRGQKGELCLAGRQLTPGYWHDEEKNKAAFFEADGRRWYRTGDVCAEEADGNILYYGRLDSQVQIQGYRVELSEIEHVAREFFAQDTAVVVIPVSNGNEIAVHLVVEGADEGQDAPLMDHLKQFLPHYMLPAGIHHMTVFPQNSSNKIDRKGIREMLFGTSGQTAANR